jgi:hypothetical protein
MVLEGQADAKKHRRRTREALEYWLRQSERLHIAKTHYRLSGNRLVDFARRIGVDRASAFELIKLRHWRKQIMSRCRADEAEATTRRETYRFPGWRTALEWFTKPVNNAHYWLTPPDLYSALDAEFDFDCDPCPYPLPAGHDALAMPWGSSNFVNPPYSHNDGPGIAAFVRKALDEQQKGKTSILLIPVTEIVLKLVAAGAEIRSLGRVPFRDTATGRPAKHPISIGAFILRGNNLGGSRDAL